jgi:hypothetical protein
VKDPGLVGPVNEIVAVVPVIATDVIVTGPGADNEVIVMPPPEKLTPPLNIIIYLLC